MVQCIASMTFPMVVERDSDGYNLGFKCSIWPQIRCVSKPDHSQNFSRAIPSDIQEVRRSQRGTDVPQCALNLGCPVVITQRALFDSSPRPFSTPELMEVWKKCMTSTFPAIGHERLLQKVSESTLSPQASARLSGRIGAGEGYDIRQERGRLALKGHRIRGNRDCGNSHKPGSHSCGGGILVACLERGPSHVVGVRRVCVCHHGTSLPVENRAYPGADVTEVGSTYSTHYVLQAVVQEGRRTCRPPEQPALLDPRISTDMPIFAPNDIRAYRAKQAHGPAA